MIVSRTLLFLLAPLLLTFTAAQKVPNFLYITTPILKPGETISGTLDEEDGQNLKDGSRLEVIQGRYMKGEVLEFNLTSTFDGYLTVYAPDKTVLTYNDDTTSSEDGDYVSEVVSEIPESGRYVFIVSGYADFDLGDYTLSATPVTLSAEGLISVPSEQQGLISLEDDLAEFIGEDETMGSLGEFNYDSYSIEITETTTVQIDVLSDILDTLIEVLDADGDRIAFKDDVYYEDDLSTDDYDESTDYIVQAGVTVTLEPGTYEIRAASYGEGLYTLVVSVAE
jgi:hypothetical protein